MSKKAGVGTIKGVGEKTEKLFEKIGVYTVDDLIHYYPRGYEIFGEPVPISEVEEGKVCTICGSVFGRVQVSPGKGRQITTAYLKDLTGTIKVIWFRMPFLRNTLGRKGAVVLRGRVVKKRDSLVMEHPEIYDPAVRYQEKINTMQPVYGLTAGLTNNAVIKALRQALEQVREQDDFLPDEFTKKYHFRPYGQSVREMHFPENKEAFLSARQRFVFEEFLVFILSLRQIKNTQDRMKNGFRFEDQPQISEFLRQLPYELTAAQLRVWDDMQKDMKSQYVMSRLVQGDVGSGKTIVAVLGLLFAGLNGYQGALMAPTEVLARQHYENFTQMCRDYDLDFPVILLTGSMTAKQKRDAYERMLLYPNALIVGTHALIQERAVYENLALVITDEQHRFGVRQREILGKKGEKPHILVMSATPIPRTLAIILYGDLDISVIDEVPAKRLPIKNCVVGTEFRPKAYEFIENQVKDGHQAYVICPLVEESENTEAENVTDYTKLLKAELPDVRIACLHGKMKPAEKNRIMEEFLNHDTDVLVSTTVIEVGVNVPNATVMLIEDAQRFGLAQLHQLRGRVGRSDLQSYCIMMNTSESKESKKRLDILNRSNDGFYIAREDLKLRGQGDFFGVRQSGEMEFAVGDIFADAGLLQEAAEDVKALVDKDPELSKEEHRALKQHMETYGEQWFEQLNL